MNFESLLRKKFHTQEVYHLVQWVSYPQVNNKVNVIVRPKSRKGEFLGRERMGQGLSDEFGGV